MTKDIKPRVVYCRIDRTMRRIPNVLVQKHLGKWFIQYHDLNGNKMWKQIRGEE
jgi:hypothetical protein